jgi:ATP-dependent protease HslVU (ClpYQ) ATPase subunit
MSKIEDSIKTKAPGSLYGEWAKKEECWNVIKNEDFNIDLNSLREELESKSSDKRKRLSEVEVENQLIQAESDFVKSIPIAKWLEISKIGSDIENMSQHLKDRAINIQSTLRLNKELSENQRKDAIKIIENILVSSPNFFDEVSEVSRMPEAETNNKISSDLLSKMVVWDTKAKVLSAKELQYIANFAYGLKTLNDFHEKNIKRHLTRLQDAGFIA